MMGRKYGGLTLIEVVVSTLLVSTVMLTSLAASTNLLRNQTAARAKTTAQVLSSQILDEITAVDFEDRLKAEFGLEPDESNDDRTTFDDVDDYHDYGETTPTHRDGTAIDGFAGWSYTVEILKAEADENGVTTVSVDGESLLRLIRVRCVSPEGASFLSTALVANCNNNVPESASYEQWRRIRFQFPDRELQLTTPLRNQPQAIESP